MIELKRPLIFLDIESTGVKPETDRIVEISMCKLHPNGEREVKTTLINPTIEIPPPSTEIHGISNEDVKDKPTFKQLAKSMLEFLNGCDVAGFNSLMFDFPILFYEFYRAGITWDYKEVQMLDIGNLYKIYEPRTLGAAYKFYCNKELENAHSAEVDILATVEVFEAQLEKYKNDIPTDLEQLCFKSAYETKRVDISGKFSYDADNDIIFNFGKYKGEKLKNNISYLNWIVYKSDFPADVCDICQTILNQY